MNSRKGYRILLVRGPLPQRSGHVEGSQNAEAQGKHGQDLVTEGNKAQEYADPEVWKAACIHALDDFITGLEDAGDLLRITPDQAALEGSGQADLEQILEQLRQKQGISTQWEWAESENWNKEWESHFAPVDLEHGWRIRAPFHEALIPEKEIVIEPAMSFGTGHHATTELMAQYLIQNPPVNKQVLDLGAGTGILAILAFKIGAARVTGVECEPHSVEAAIKNAGLNGIPQKGISWVCGTVLEVPAAEKFDLIVANIQLNVLLEELPEYRKRLQKAGHLIMSGVLEKDLPQLVQRSQEHGLKLVSSETKGTDKWCRVQFVAA